MSTPTKSPVKLIADLTDQIRLLRQDVVSLTDTATNKAEAAGLMALVQKITVNAQEQNRQIGSTAAEMPRRMERDSVTAAHEAAGKDARVLEDQISAVANLRLESVRGRKEAFQNFRRGLAVFGGLAGSGGGGVLVVVALLLIQVARGADQMVRTLRSLLDISLPSTLRAEGTIKKSANRSSNQGCHPE